MVLLVPPRCAGPQLESAYLSTRISRQPSKRLGCGFWRTLTTRPNWETIRKLSSTRLTSLASAIIFILERPLFLQLWGLFGSAVHNDLNNSKVSFPNFCVRVRGAVKCHRPNRCVEKNAIKVLNCRRLLYTEIKSIKDESSVLLGAADELIVRCPSAFFSFSVSRVFFLPS